MKTFQSLGMIDYQLFIAIYEGLNISKAWPRFMGVKIIHGFELVMSYFILSKLKLNLNLNPSAAQC